MERFVAGDVVVVVFPHSNLKSYKRRPALILSQGDFNDIIVCQITSQQDDSLNTVRLDKSSFASGDLPVTSYARPDKLITLDQQLIVRRAGKLTNKSIEIIKRRLADIFEI